MSKLLFMILSLLTILLIFGCANEDITTETEEDVEEQTFDENNYVKPVWDAFDSQSNLFYVKQQQRIINIKNNAVAVENTVKSETDEELKEVFESEWSNNLYFKYQVINSGFVPSETDSLYKYHMLGNEASPLTLIKATLAEFAAEDDELFDLNPSLYLVIRENTNRLVAVVYFYNQGSERQSEAYDLTDPTQKANFISTTKLFPLPYYMPSFPVKKENHSMKLEDGSDFQAQYENEKIDVKYSNAIDKSVISQKWENGKPWAESTETDKIKSDLMTQDEVDTLRITKKRAMPLPAVNDDYAKKLKEAIDLKAALKLKEEDFKDGAASISVELEQYLPWSGSWWPLSTAKLAYGFQNGTIQKTFTLPDNTTKRVKVVNCADTVFETKLTDTDTENFCEKTQRLAVEADYYYQKIINKTVTDEDKVKRQEKVSELTKYMSDFFNQFNADFKAKKIIVRNNKIEKEINASVVWSFELDKQSPMMKYAIWHATKEYDYNVKNPFLMVAWEILNSFHPTVGTGWWGHCNGWSGAAILTNEPAKEGYAIDLGNGNTMNLGVGDVKGLLTESHYSSYSNFYGARYNGKEGDDISDLSPEAFHKIITIYLRDRKVPFVFDTSANEEVWNFPIYGYDMLIDETTPGSGPQKLDVNTATVAQLDALVGITKKQAQNITKYREVNGPFQVIEDLKKVTGMTTSKYNKIKDKISVGVIEQTTPEIRTFDVLVELKIASDGVSEDYFNDANPGYPEGFTESYEYSLETDKNGTIIKGIWKDPSKHPDFAWTPYSNQDYNSSSENPYLKWSSLKKILPESIQRVK